jgi:indolepyruvate ferredoxin oxidoreductase
MLPGDFTRNAEFSLPTQRLKRAITGIAGEGRSHFIDASHIATALLGQSIGANMFMLGYAYQLGALPLSSEAIERALELNGEAVAMNVSAFRWGRRAAVDLAGVEKLAAPLNSDPARKLSESFDEVLSRRVAFLTDYQDAAYAARYRSAVEKIRAVEAAKTPGKTQLADSVARYLFKLMAYKDEYEVARLYSTETFRAQVTNEVGGDKLRLHVHLAPPLFARRNKVTGEPRKTQFGPWIFPVFGVLAKFKFLRGGVFDPFGYTAERKIERRLIADYEALLAEISGKLTAGNHSLAVGLAGIPEKIRGFGHVKLRHLQSAKAEEAALLEQFRATPTQLLKAAE